MRGKGCEKTCRYQGKSVQLSAPHGHVGVALGPVQVGTGGSSVVFQH